MVNGLGIDRLDDGQVVHDASGVRQQLADPRSVFAMPLELESRRSDRKSFLPRCHRGNPLPITNRIRQVLVVPLVHLGLVIPHVKLRRST